MGNTNKQWQSWKSKLTQSEGQKKEPNANANTKLSTKKGKRAQTPATANSLTNAVLAYLNLKGFYAWRQNNVGVWDSAKSVYRKSNRLRGVSDVLGIHIGTGKMIAVEVKAGKDRLSDQQTDFLDNIQKAGGVAIVARNFDNFKTDLDAVISSWSQKQTETILENE